MHVASPGSGEQQSMGLPHHDMGFAGMHCHLCLPRVWDPSQPLESITQWSRARLVATVALQPTCSAARMRGLGEQPLQQG